MQNLSKADDTFALNKFREKKSQIIHTFFQQYNFNDYVLFYVTQNLSLEIYSFISFYFYAFIILFSQIYFMKSVFPLG